MNERLKVFILQNFVMIQVFGVSKILNYVQNILKHYMNE